MRNYLGVVFSFAVVFLSFSRGLSAEPALAPDFVLPDIKEDIVILSSYRDKQPIVLFFWTTSCPYCIRELKVLDNKTSVFKKDGVELLAINIGEPRYRLENFIKYHSLALSAIKMLLDKDGAVASAYDILGVPTYVLIDKKGAIRLQEHSFSEQEYNELISQ